MNMLICLFPYNTAAKRIEQVQDEFIRILFFRRNGFFPSFRNHISYDQLISHLGLEKLESRRVKQDFNFLPSTSPYSTAIATSSFVCRSSSIFFPVTQITKSFNRERKTGCLKLYSAFDES